MDKILIISDTSPIIIFWLKSTKQCFNNKYLMLEQGWKLNFYFQSILYRICAKVKNFLPKRSSFSGECKEIREESLWNYHIGEQQMLDASSSGVQSRNNCWCCPKSVCENPTTSIRYNAKELTLTSLRWILCKNLGLYLLEYNSRSL